MDTRLTHQAICSFIWLVICSPLNAAVITDLNMLTGPAFANPNPSIPIATPNVDNDDNLTQINFNSPFSILSINGADDPINVVLNAVDSGTGGTTEYIFNFVLSNSTPVPWSNMRFTLSAQTTSGGSLTASGLDFDSPDPSTTGFSSLAFPHLTRQATQLLWSGSTVGVGGFESSVFTIDVPDIGIDYQAVLTLEVFTTGDLDFDGFVGINDLNLVLANWNQNVPPGNGLADPSGDGFVGIDDLNIVLGNWNAGTPPGASAITTPEPSSLLALTAGLLLLDRCRGGRVGR